MERAVKTTVKIYSEEDDCQVCLVKGHLKCSTCFFNADNSNWLGELGKDNTWSSISEHCVSCSLCGNVLWIVVCSSLQILLGL